LLVALDDPNRVVPAHMFLIWTQPGPWRTFPLPSVVNNTVSQDYDGLLVRGTPSVSNVAAADPSGWQVIRDRWHDRLDRQLVHMRYMWLVAATGILPLLWAAVKYQQIRNRRLLGLCPTCHYNLTGNTSGTCPECGSPVPSSTATRQPQSD
jgi:hypothetical protein